MGSTLFDKPTALRWEESVTHRSPKEQLRIVSMHFAFMAIPVLFGMARPALANVCVDHTEITTQGVAQGRRFMIATAHPLATRAGCNILEAGGSAIDAAIAAQAVLAVVEPQSSGLAGGAAITYWDAAHHRVRFFEGLSGAPLHVTDDLRAPTEDDLGACGLSIGQSFSSRVDVTGRAFGVPGALRVLDQVHRRFGRKAWNELFEAAIDLAEDGFPMPPYLHTVMSANTDGLARCQYPDLRALYCNGDTPKDIDALITNPSLAEVLREVQDGGAKVFYDPQGTIAPAIVDRVTTGTCQPEHDTSNPIAQPAFIPSLVTVDDFADYRARERDPLCRSVLEHTVCSSPPPTFGGVTLLYILELLQRGHVQQWTPGSLEQAHLFIEASRLAQFDRRQYIGDPDFNYNPIDGLLDEDYLNARFALFSPVQAITQIGFGNPPGGIEPPPSQSIGVDSEDHDTTSHISIVDTRGNALSMTTTINSNFGNQMVARGMSLNNVQTNFTRPDSISPGNPVNIMEPHKKARTSIAPTLVFDQRKHLKLVVGAAGGGAIPDYVAQTIIGILAYRMDPREAIQQDHVSGQEITSNCGGVIGPRSEIEADTASAALLDDLRALGHPCARTTDLQSGLTAIQIQHGLLRGAADPRRDGDALGE